MDFMKKVGATASSYRHLRRRKNYTYRPILCCGDFLELQQYSGFTFLMLILFFKFALPAMLFPFSLSCFFLCLSPCLHLSLFHLCSFLYHSSLSSSLSFLWPSLISSLCSFPWPSPLSWLCSFCFRAFLVGPYEQPALMCGGLSSDGVQEEEKLSKDEVGV